MESRTARERLATLRDDTWLGRLLDEIWSDHFSDVERVNQVVVEFTRHWKTRLGLIRMTECETETYIGINGMLRHPAVPEVVVRMTVAHELCHYVHGFGSPFPRRYSHPHAGNVVAQELEVRGLGRQLLHSNDWIADQWHSFWEAQSALLAKPRPTGFRAKSLAMAASDAPRQHGTIRRMSTQPSRELETFPNPHPGREYEIVITAPEFTSLCPVTGQPDFGTITVTYVPGTRCVELKSFKLYLWTYRDEGAFYEDVTNRIMNDLLAALEPVRMTVTGDFNVRGGIKTVVTVRHGMG